MNPTHYPCGHPRTEENTVMHRMKGKMYKACLECRKEIRRRASRKYQAKLRRMMRDDH